MLVVRATDAADAADAPARDTAADAAEALEDARASEVRSHGRPLLYAPRAAGEKREPSCNMTAPAPSKTATTTRHTRCTSAPFEHQKPPVCVPVVTVATCATFAAVVPVCLLLRMLVCFGACVGVSLIAALLSVVSTLTDARCCCCSDVWARGGEGLRRGGAHRAAVSCFCRVNCVGTTSSSTCVSSTVAIS